MSIELHPGDKVVARGKVAVIKQVFSRRSIKVTLKSTGESIIVPLSEIELIDAPDKGATNNGLPDRKLSDCSQEELERAVKRFNVIGKWRSCVLSLAESSAELGITSHHLYKLDKLYDEQIGPLSLVPQKRGRKQGATRLDEKVEDVIIKAIQKTYKTRAASYRKVWVEVLVTCGEKGFEAPSKDTVTRRIKSVLSERERSLIKKGVDSANQTHQARPGKKKTVRPLEWVQMDHTLVDVLLLADNRCDLIGRPWLTILIDVYTRVVLGYYLSLHPPSSVSVACALTHAVLQKNEFTKGLGLEPDDYPFFGMPTVLHMDNAAEFTSPKLKVGCNSFGIDTAYRPPGRKHYGGHVERLIGTMMTSKVHFLKGTTMSNAVARRNMNSENQANMTFSDFTKWFAREVIVYHATVHDEIKSSPRQAWAKYFASSGGQPYQTRVSDPLQFKLFFMPEETRTINPYGIELHGQRYWDPILSRFIGTKNAIVKYDPYLSQNIWIKLEGEFYPVGLSDLTVNALSYEEYRAARFFREPVNTGAIVDSSGKRAYREKQEIEINSARLTKAERRKHAAAGIYSGAYPAAVRAVQSEPVKKPDYTKPPKKFGEKE